MSCGRRNAEVTNQAAEVPRARASSRRAFSQSNHYNRLEYRRWFCLLYAAVHSIFRQLSAPLRRSRRVAAGTHVQLAKPQAFLSLVQVRESCHKQVCGVTPFRRGIA
jgi:hypothetical protein